MKRLIALFVAGMTLASGAHAADVYRGTYSTKDAPTTAITTTVERPGFAGPYAGVSLSWQAMDVEHRGDLSAGFFGLGEYKQIASGKLADMSDQSFRGGVQVGYQWQLGRLYAGPRLAVDFGKVEAGLSRVDTFGDDGFSASHYGKLKVSSDFLATASLKLGVAITDNVGIYGVGGLSIADIDVEGNGSWSADYDGKQLFSGFAPWQAANSETKLGWHIGAGVDFVMGDWNAFAEYTYHDLGTVDSSGTVYAGAIAYNHEADVTLNVVKAGVNRRF